MPQKSKWFRVATEGATTDGRAIERSWIEQMAKNFSQAKYGARVWIEHMRGLLPDSAFAAQGDVVAVKAEAVEDGKLALFAQIKPLESLVAMNKAGQKLYTSIEVDPNFAGTGEAYLVGLAVTDSPASLGTELLQFAQQHPAASPLAHRKTNANTLFTAGQEFTLELEEATDPTAASADPSVFNTVVAAFAKALGLSAAPAASTPATPAAAAPAAFTAEQQAAVAQALEGLKAFGQQQIAAMDALRGDFSALSAKHSELVAKLSQQPADPARPTASGGHGQQLAEF
ncbi:GPO family capsid scaffolding protein [Comamonas aquatica]|uniref:GPO family capsid scaffolding protein n=1 Tax=Comamonas aquatica TaxID=225991 RepID=UPI00244A33BE|nr:GPO family capsid scaffolding protein [Comamonas aquatica]MDH0200797.1 GPO family capsid scaffolding protein [Comamonas aquatica]MDH1445669.1 GPO family capsid scaffolding protein [Comamonas aquatica]